MRRWLGAALATTGVALVAAGCGGSGATTVTETVQSANTGATHAPSPPEPDFTGCPESKTGYATGRSIVAEGRKSVEEGIEVQIAEEDIRLGEKMARNAVSGCKVERELAAKEAKICANTPRQLEEAFREEETRGAAEYIGIYEVTCGKRVNLP